MLQYHKVQLYQTAQHISKQEEKNMKKLIATLLSIIILAIPTTPISAAIYQNGSKVTDLVDLKGTWYESGVLKVANLKGCITTSDDTHFGPNDLVTREEFIRILSMISYWNLDGTFNPGEPPPQQLYSDVPVPKDYNDPAWHLWQATTIAHQDYSKEGGGGPITRGVGDGKFAPEAPITRQDLIAMLMRYHNHRQSIDNLYYVCTDESSLSRFTDADQIKDYAKNSVNVMSHYNVIGGYPDGSFKPDNHVTRAECYKILGTYLSQKAQLEISYRHWYAEVTGTDLYFAP
jgi:hypothetical protein